MRIHIKLVVLGSVFGFAACKPGQSPQRKPLGQGGAESFALLPDDSQLLCPCTEIVPVARRPMFPRVRGLTSGSTVLQGECRYAPAAGALDSDGLILSAFKTTRKLAFDEAQALSDEVKVLARERRTLTVVDGAMPTPGKAVPFFMALVTNSQGTFRVTVAHAAEETILIKSQESVAPDDTSLAAAPPYFDGLPERILALCR